MRLAKFAALAHKRANVDKAGSFVACVDPRRLAALRKRGRSIDGPARAARRWTPRHAGRAKSLGRRADRARKWLCNATSQLGGLGHRDVPPRLFSSRSVAARESGRPPACPTNDRKRGRVPWSFPGPGRKQDRRRPFVTPGPDRPPHRWFCRSGMAVWQGRARGAYRARHPAGRGPFSRLVTGDKQRIVPRTGDYLGEQDALAPRIVAVRGNRSSSRSVESPPDRRSSPRLPAPRIGSEH